MSVSEPGKIITPWAESGLKNPIPPAANPATGRAGFDQGFSAINMTAKEAGGIPPFGQDFNGIFYEVTNILRYMQAGGQPTFDAALATAIGGYPKGAMVLGNDGTSVYKNIVDSNSSNPNSGGSGWAREDLILREALRRSYAEAGYNLVDGSFEGGGVVTSTVDVLLHASAGKGYSYLGAIPPGGYVVPPATNPVDNANWNNVSDEYLKDALSEVGGSELVNSAVAYLSSLAALAAYDGGKTTVVITDPIDGGVFVVDANASLADPVLAVLAANGNKYKRLYELKSARFYGVSSTRTDNAVQLNAAANSGGRVVIPDGVTLFNSEILTDYSDPAFPDEITPSKRTVIAGESINNTLLSYGGVGYGIKRIGLDIDQPAAQGIHSDDGLENFVLHNRNTFLGEGIYLQNKAHMLLSNLRVRNFNIGVHLVGCLSSSLSDIYADANEIGLLIKESSFSAPNALHMSSVFAKNNRLAGISGLLGAGNKLSGFTIEGNGTTAGDVSQGGVLLELSGGNGSAAVEMSSGYFEANCGIADLQLINVTPENITVKLSEVLFRRDSNVRFTTNNIVLRSLGGGTLTLITDGCTFESVGTYVPSASRPFVDYGEACNWIDRGSTFSETISLSGGPALGYRMPTHGYSRAGQVNADGTIGIGSNGISVVKEGVGTYLVSYAATMPKAFGSLVGSYIATAIANGPFSVNATCEKVSERAFRVYTRTTPDEALIDATFSWEVHTLA